MSIFDKAKQELGEHRDKIDQAVDKAGDMVDERTGGKYADKIDRVQDKAKDQADRHFGDADSGEPSTEADPENPETGTDTPGSGPTDQPPRD